MCLHSHQSSHFTSHLCKRILIFNSEYKVHQWADESASMSLVHLKIGFFLTWIKGGKKGEGGRGGQSLWKWNYCRVSCWRKWSSKIECQQGRYQIWAQHERRKKKKTNWMRFLHLRRRNKIDPQHYFQASLLCLDNSQKHYKTKHWHVDKSNGTHLLMNARMFFSLFFSKFWSSGICPEMAATQLAHLTLNSRYGVVEPFFVCPVMTNMSTQFYIARWNCFFSL